MDSLSRIFRCMQQLGRPRKCKLGMTGQQHRLVFAFTRKCVRGDDRSRAADTSDRECAFALGEDKFAPAGMRMSSDASDVYRRQIARAFGHYQLRVERGCEFRKSHVVNYRAKAYLAAVSSIADAPRATARERAGSNSRLLPCRSAYW